MDAARLYARMGREADGFDAVVSAIEAGWSVPVALDDSPDLAVFRSRQEFSRLVQLVGERAELRREAEAIGRL